MERSALKTFEKKALARARKQKDVLMEKYSLEKLKDCSGVAQILETFKDDFNVYIRMEAFTGGEIWNKVHTFG